MKIVENGVEIVKISREVGENVVKMRKKTRIVENAF